LSGAVAVFGGTFDPVHFGHLRSALELTELLSLERLLFMPAAQPPHRERPAVSAEHRAAMLELAIAGEARFSCDRRELRREGPSYSVLSLEELRLELGAKTPLYMILGADALGQLHQWHRWEELLTLAHLLAIARPGWDWPRDGPVAALLQQRGAPAEVLAATPAGSLCIQTLRPQAISSTAIRSLLQSGRSVRYLTPDSVLDYIARNNLYSATGEVAQE
jgi:nicotinate-nucleotide adenylyltransferase